MVHDRLARRIASTLVFAIVIASAGSMSAIAASPAPSSPAAEKAPVAGLSSNFVRDETRGEEELGLTETEIIRRVDATEGLIAQCMSDAGFEYFPVSYATARSAMDSNSKPSGITADEFRSQFGYGVTTLLDGPTTQSTLSVGDRNAAYKEGLATADRVAYERTMYGENPNNTFVVALDREDFSQVGGCTRAAVSLIFSQAELGANFVNYQNEAGSRIAADPRVIAAYKDWSTCMREAGYAYDDPSSIRAGLAAKLDEITGGATVDTLSATNTASLAALQGEERAVAAKDHECDLQYVADVKLAVEAEILGAASQP